MSPRRSRSRRPARTRSQGQIHPARRAGPAGSCHPMTFIPSDAGGKHATSAFVASDGCLRGSAHCAAGPGGRPRRQKALPAGASSDWWTRVQRSIQLEEYGIVGEGVDGARFRAANPAHRFEARFDAGGMRLAPTEGSSWEWRLALTGWGRPGSLEAGSVAGLRCGAGPCRIRPRPTDRVVRQHVQRGSSTGSRFPFGRERKATNWCSTWRLRADCGRCSPRTVRRSTSTRRAASACCATASSS